MTDMPGGEGASHFMRLNHLDRKTVSFNDPEFPSRDFSGPHKRNNTDMLRAHRAGPSLEEGKKRVILCE